MILATATARDTTTATINVRWHHLEGKLADCGVREKGRYGRGVFFSEDRSCHPAPARVILILTAKVNAVMHARSQTRNVGISTNARFE